MKITLYSELSQKHQIYIDRINGVLESNNVRMKIYGVWFVDGVNNIGRARAALTCCVHGDCFNFDNPYSPFMSNLYKIKNGGCNKCSRKYNPTEQEALLAINASLKAKNCRFIKFISNYSGRNTKLEYETKCCMRVIQISVNQAVNGKTGCKKCNHLRSIQSRKRTGTQLAETLESMFNGSFVTFYIDSEALYSNKDAVWCFCSFHNLKFKKTVNKLLHRKNSHSPCAKCSKLVANENAKYSFDEQKERITEALSEYPEVQYKLEHVEQGNMTEIGLNCAIHNLTWRTTINQVVQGKSRCKTCAHNSHHLAGILRQDREELLFSPRYFYVVQLTKTDKTDSWYKIGVTTSGLKSRYNPKALMEDNLTITGEPKLLKLDSLSALMLERYILLSSDFSGYRLDKKNEMGSVDGGTECFSVNPLDIKSPEDLLDEAYAQAEKVVRCTLKKEKRSNAMRLIRCYLAETGNKGQKIKKRITLKAKCRVHPDLTAETLFSLFNENGCRIEKTANVLGMNRGSLRARMRRLGIYNR